MHRSIAIRPAETSDLDFFLEIDRISCDREGTPWKRGNREPLIGSFTHSDRNFGFVAVKQGERVGGILLRQRTTADSDLSEGTRSMVVPAFGKSESFLDIFDIWVHPESRRRGIARMLKLATEDECRVRGVRWIFTFQHPDNVAAIRMNEALHYIHIGQTTMWDEVPRVCFARDLRDLS